MKQLSDTFRLTSFITLALILYSCNSNTKTTTEEKPPNILFIMSDDHAFQAVSAYGHGLNNTPNIDRIAKEGAIFNKGFVTNSICAPSRAAMLTGKHSFVNGKVDNMQPFDWEQPNFAKLLQQAGYQTALIGKIHLNGLPLGFDYSSVLPGQGNYYNPDFIENGVKKRFPGYVTSITTDLALDWLDKKRDKEKPFLLLYHQKAPHRNWKPEEKYLTLFDDKTFDPPANYFDDYEGRGTAAHQQEMQVDGHAKWGHDFKMLVDPNGDSTGFDKELKRFDEKQLAAWMAAYTPKNDAMKAAKLEGKELGKWKYNRYIKDYLRTIQSVDDGVGQVLDYLDENGLTENTIVVYTSDQGFYLGEHGWFDKRFMYEESLRTPLLMRYPKEIKPGGQINQLIQNIDFAPTFLDYAGANIPEDIQGESFRKIVSGESSEWRDAIYYTYYEYPSVHMVKRHYGVRTDRYKLMHFYYDIDEWEMYDLEKDPSEMKNVYDDPAYQAVRESMHERLVEMRKKYGDSDENDQMHLNRYLEAINKRKKG
ncbi:sulfatase [Reichenbachiella sp. MALMAid0571]|uniref:sulfatase family protein n=1 Tax=Reichenbachiella sp. MALMAid0571 TaxID=3143939 RepID=UPI0032DE45AC